MTKIQLKTQYITSVDARGAAEIAKSFKTSTERQ